MFPLVSELFYLTYDNFHFNYFIVKLVLYRTVFLIKTTGRSPTLIDSSSRHYTLTRDKTQVTSSYYAYQHTCV